MSAGSALPALLLTRFDRLLEQEIGASRHLSQAEYGPNRDAEHNRRLEATRQQLAVYESHYQQIQRQIEETQEVIEHFLDVVNRLDSNSKDTGFGAALIVQLKAFRQLHVPEMATAKATAV